MSDKMKYVFLYLWSWAGWQPEDHLSSHDPPVKNDMEVFRFRLVHRLGVGVLVGWGVTMIRISLWLTRWAGCSLKSQGSQIRRPPSNTSTHFTGPTSSYYLTRPLAFFSMPLPLLLSLSRSPSFSFYEVEGSIREMKNGVQLAEHFLPLVGVNSSLCW